MQQEMLLRSNWASLKDLFYEKRNHFQETPIFLLHTELLKNVFLKSLIFPFEAYWGLRKSEEHPRLRGLVSSFQAS